MYWYVSIYSEESFWPQHMYPNLRPNNGYRWCPLGKLSHLGLEQLTYVGILLEVCLFKTEKSPFKGGCIDSCHFPCNVIHLAWNITPWLIMLLLFWSTTLRWNVHGCWTYVKGKIPASHNYFKVFFLWKYII